MPKDSPYKSYAELDKEGVTVGALGASTYAEVGKKMLPKATLKEFSGGSAPVGQALSTGRLDAGIMSLSTANQFLVDFGNLRVLDGVMVREPLALSVSYTHLVAFLLTARYLELCARQSFGGTAGGQRHARVEAQRQRLGAGADRLASRFVMAQVALALGAAAAWALSLIHI